MRNIFDANHYWLREIERHVHSVMPRLPYHNFNHVMEASAVAQTLATRYSFSAQERFCLGAAMRLHDVIYVPGEQSNEERSAREAKGLLQILGVTADAIATTMNLILATKPEFEPQTLLEKIAKDADMHNLGTPYFFETMSRVRSEFSPMSDAKWYSRVIQNIGHFQFQTQSAQLLYGQMWDENRLRLQQLYEFQMHSLLKEAS